MTHEGGLTLLCLRGALSAWLSLLSAVGLWLGDGFWDGVTFAAWLALQSAPIILCFWDSVTLGAWLAFQSAPVILCLWIGGSNSESVSFAAGLALLAAVSLGEGSGGDSQDDGEDNSDELHCCE